MLNELRNALKSEISKVRTLRQQLPGTKGYDRALVRAAIWHDRHLRRAMHLAACYVRRTPYEAVEHKNADSPGDHRRLVAAIADILIQYGCADKSADREEMKADVERWMKGAAATLLAPQPLSKLYTVVRADLPLGAQAVQAAHAMREFAHLHPEVEAEWHRTSNTVVMLSVPDEAALVDLKVRLCNAHISVAEFHEPDLNHSLTAICVAPDGSRMLRNLPLALQGSKVAA
jgi:hypothetical protein